MLIECNCFNLSRGITLVNDSDLIFFGGNKTETPIPLNYVNIQRAAVLWVAIGMTVVWMIFAWFGHKRDLIAIKKHKLIGPKKSGQRQKQPSQ